MAVLSRRWTLLWRAAPTLSLAQIKEQLIFLVVDFEQDAVQIRGEFVSVGVNIQRHCNIFAPATVDDPCLLRCVRLGPVECVLHAAQLGGYDGSLDDDPESGFAHLDAPLDRAVGRFGQALEAAAALRADAVGAAGGGMLAWVVAAESAQATCSAVCLAGNRNFAHSVHLLAGTPSLLNARDKCYADLHYSVPLLGHRPSCDRAPPHFERQCADAANTTWLDPPEPPDPAPLLQLHAGEARWSWSASAAPPSVVDEPAATGVEHATADHSGGPSTSSCYGSKAVSTPTCGTVGMHLEMVSAATATPSSATSIPTRARSPSSTTPEVRAATPQSSTPPLDTLPMVPAGVLGMEITSSTRVQKVFDEMALQTKISIEGVIGATAAGSLFILHLSSAHMVMTLAVHWNFLVLLGCMRTMMVQFVQLPYDMHCRIFLRDSYDRCMNSKCSNCVWFKCHWPLPAWVCWIEAKTSELVAYELLQTRNSRVAFLHLSATTQSDLHVLPCCIFCGLVQPIRLLHWLAQGTFHSLFFLLNECVEDAPVLAIGATRWIATDCLLHETNGLLLHECKIVAVTQMRMKVLLDCTLPTVFVMDCIALQPWPPPELLDTIINSKLFETCLVASKLNVLDRVVVAQVLLMCDEAQLLPTPWLSFCARYCPVAASSFSGDTMVHPYLWIQTTERHGVVLWQMQLLWSSYELLQDPVELFASSILSHTCIVYVTIRTKCSQGTFTVQSCLSDNQTSRAYVHITIENGALPWDPSGLDLERAATGVRCMCRPQALLSIANGFRLSRVIFRSLKFLHQASSYTRTQTTFLRSMLSLQIPWDPGGIDIVHRLEGKPNFKKGGMLGYTWATSYLGHGPRSSTSGMAQYKSAATHWKGASIKQLQPEYLYLYRYCSSSSLLLLLFIFLISLLQPPFP